MAGKLDNLEAWITQALSLPIEIIICHDVQDERTGVELRELLNAFGEKSNIKFIEGKYGSPGATRNEGIALANNKWVVFWDSDDFPEVKTAIEAIKQASDTSKVIITKFRQIDRTTGDFKESSQFSNSSKRNLCILASEIGIWRYIFKKEILNGKRFQKFRMGEDAFFLSEFQSYLKDAEYVNLITYNYYTGVENQATSQISLRSENLIAIRKLEEADLQFFGKLLKNKLVISDLLLNKNFAKFPNLVLRTLTESNLMGGYFLYLLAKKRLLLVKKKSLPAAGISLVGGFGNQLFQLSAIISVRRFPEERVLLEWGLGSVRLNSQKLPAISDLDLNHNYLFHKGRFLSKFTSKCIGFARNFRRLRGKTVAGRRVHQVIHSIAKLISFIYFKKNRSILVFEDIGYSNLQKMDEEFLLLGYFQSYKYLEVPGVRNEMTRLLKPKATPLYNYFLALSKIEQPIVLHIRLGDYRLEDKFGIIDIGYITTALARIQGSENRTIWLFSDETDAALAMLTQEIRGRVRVIDIEDTFVSFQIMRLGHDYVISNSTFSWWSAAMSLNRDAQVCVPDPWFKELEPPSDMIPKKWFRVKAWK